MIVIETDNVSKVFKNGLIKKKIYRAIQDISIRINQGEIYSLIGANGAGKTTFIKILLGLIIPSSGNLKIFGKDIKDESIRSRIGYLPESDVLPSYLTGEMFLRTQASYYSTKRSLLFEKVEEILEFLDLSKWKRTKIKNYSKGMKRRLLLSSTILHNPDLFILDEPTDGIDIEGRYIIRNLLRSLRNQGKTVLINSHIISEIEQISDRIGVLKDGSLAATGTIDDFLKKDNIIEITITDDLPNHIIEAINKISPSCYSSGHKITINDGNTGTVNRVIDQLRKAGLPIKDVQKQSITLEEYFLQEYYNY